MRSTDASLRRSPGSGALWSRHCRLGSSRFPRRTAKQEQAREHLTLATTMYREMDMRFWLEQAEAEMGS
jgi:hypothetical protein